MLGTGSLKGVESASAKVGQEQQDPPQCDEERNKKIGKNSGERKGKGRNPCVWSI